MTQESTEDEPKGCRCPNCPERLGTGTCACCEDRRLSEQFPDPPEYSDSTPTDLTDKTYLEVLRSAGYFLPMGSLYTNVFEDLKDRHLVYRSARGYELTSSGEARLKELDKLSKEV